ncbi:MAG TPA: hypothetical protein VJ717_13765 [Gemmatimonadaceae bacterium]|nr:hypothetical protein [Gemmatimonadaceae bacterium]
MLAQRSASLMIALLLAMHPVAGQASDEPRRIRALGMRAQQQFESFRRRQLPVTGGRSGSSDCDVRIGRFCYWHDDADALPAEPERIAAARVALLRALDSLARVNASDEWLVGQRIRYLVEADRAHDARRAANECRGTLWWCSALTGFAEHALGDYAAADTAFSQALVAMPEAERCKWLDLSDLVPEDYRKEYGAVPCARRDSVNAHVWWLADPRWADTGNDLRTEVFARLTMSHLVQQARSAHDMAWGEDMAELMLRYGWPTAWSRTMPSSVDPTRISVVGHEPSPSFEFMPAGRAIKDALRADSANWTPTADRPTTRYAPKYARRFAGVAPQVAWFARGDSAAVVVAYEVGSRDTVFRRDSVTGAVALSRGPTDFAVAQSGTGARRNALVLGTRREPALVSVEVADSSAGAYGRARFGIAPPADSALSDILLFERGEGLPRDFAAAVGRALGTLTVAREREFGLYWELYGNLARSQTVTYSVTVERIGAGWLRRLAERVRLRDRPQPVRVGFDDHPGVQNVAARSLFIDVSHIPAGRYRLTLTAHSGDVEARRERVIEVK